MQLRLLTAILFSLTCSAHAFEMVGYGEYRMENSRWVWAWTAYSPRVEKSYNYPLEGVDAPTFTKINPEHAKDRRSVYFRGRTIKGADPATFRNLGREFWSDDHAVYWGSAALKGSDPNTFVRLNTGWAKDAQHYYSTYVPGLAVECDYTSLTFSPRSYLYAYDKTRVYWCGLMIPGADPKTFVAEDLEHAHDPFRRYLGPLRRAKLSDRMDLWDNVKRVDMHTHR
ncbi:MAG: DKNYY domain-containing protein [Undibacterium sp.]|nr:DKNYY domain-containing protein [Opitutaceae bacterium]